MALYRYEYLDADGKKKTDASEAGSREEIVTNLQTRGMVLIRWLDKGRRFSVEIKRSSRLLSQAERVQFTKDLAHLLKSDMPVDRALSIIQSSSGQSGITRLSAGLKKSVQEGNTLSGAMASFHSDFPPLYVNMIKVGEEGGVLVNVMQRLADFLERSLEIRKYIVSTSIYPCILLAVGLVSVLVIMGFVVPRFAAIFNDLGQKMPLSTKVLMNMSFFLREWWWCVLIAVIAAAGVVWHFSKTAGGKIFIDRFMYRLPVLGPLLISIQLATFARTLGTLLTTGVPILRALYIVKDVTSSRLLKDCIEDIREKVRQGNRMSGVMKESDLFPPMLVQMISLGEESGRMGEMLESAADDLDAKNKSRITNLLALLEPLAILGMAVIIGGIVVSMLSTIFGINNISF